MIARGIDVRSEFPILHRTVHGTRPLVYLDNAATTQKPQAVIDAITAYYSTSNANVHRGGHALGVEATALFEDARSVVASFLGCGTDEVVFTRGTTESINLASASLAEMLGDLTGREVVITEMEHHANIVPWQEFCRRTGATLRVIRVHDNGLLDMDDARNAISATTAVLAATHVSNTLGVTNDVATLCDWARTVGAISVIDGAQAVVHHAIDMRALGCDLYAFSGHKLYAPTGIGVLFGRRDLLNAMPPYQTGGAMIREVTFGGTTFEDAPLRFEAGTPNMEGAVGLAAAIRWFRELDPASVREHERALTDRLLSVLASVDGIRILGPGSEHAGIASFVIDGVHAHDLGTLLDEQGIAIRTGHHCTQPLLARFGLRSAARASVAVYSTDHDIDAFATALTRAVRMLR
jgi:cysteine desulfurase/selenocysteine lyase